MTSASTFLHRAVGLRGPRTRVPRIFRETPRRTRSTLSSLSSHVARSVAPVTEQFGITEQSHEVITRPLPVSPHEV